MKEKMMILLISLGLVLAITFLIFNYQTGMTGFAVLNESSENEDQVTNATEIKTITKQDALLAINESEQIIQEMLKHNFSILYMNDTLLEAKIIYEQAKYAEILRGDVNATEAGKSEASKALSLVKWKEIGYADILIYTNDIKERKEKAFLLIDEIAIEENKINPEEGELFSERLFKYPPAEPSDETKQILEDAKTAFQEDRYQDTENLLEEFRNALEQETAEASTLSGIKKGAKNFFQRYLFHIIIALILLSIIGYFTYKKFGKKLIKKKIRKMIAEKEVLMRLMKKAQEDRFKKNIISGLVYNIRMKKYQEREQEIKQELPVLEARLVKKKKEKVGKK